MAKVRVQHPGLADEATGSVQLKAPTGTARLFVKEGSTWRAVTGALPVTCLLYTSRCV